MGMFDKPKKARVRLDAEDFAKLIGGDIVIKDGAQIILADIGYDMMQALLHKEIINPLRKR
jgi:hypothetical protein